MFVHLAQGKAPLVLSLAAWYRVAPSISMSPKGRAGHDGPLSLGNLFAVTESDLAVWARRTRYGTALRFRATGSDNSRSYLDVIASCRSGCLSVWSFLCLPVCQSVGCYLLVAAACCLWAFIAQCVRFGRELIISS